MKKLIAEVGKPDIIYASSPTPTTAVLGIQFAKKLKIKNIIESIILIISLTVLIYGSFYLFWLVIAILLPMP